MKIKGIVVENNETQNNDPYGYQNFQLKIQYDETKHFTKINPNIGRIVTFHLDGRFYHKSIDRFHDINLEEDMDDYRYYTQSNIRNLTLLRNLKVGDRIEFEAFIVEKNGLINNNERDVNNYSESSNLWVSTQHSDVIRMNPDKNSAKLIRLHNRKIKNMRMVDNPYEYKEKWWVNKRFIGFIISLSIKLIKFFSSIRYAIIEYIKNRYFPT